MGHGCVLVPAIVEWFCEEFFRSPGDEGGAASFAGLTFRNAQKGALLEEAPATVCDTEAAQRALQHALNPHGANSKLIGSKRPVTTEQELMDLVAGANDIKVFLQGNGNWRREVSVGRRIFTDRYGSPTDVFTIITDENGDFVTAFGGVDEP